MVDITLVTVKEIASKEFLKVSKNESLANVVKSMEKFKTDRAIVYSNLTPEGILTKKDIITRVATTKSRRYPISALHASSVMTSPLYTTQPNVTLPKAARVMVEKNFSCLPIIEGDEVTGMLTKWDIAKILTTNSRPLSQIMTTDVTIVRDTDSLIMARKLMIDEGFSSLPVVNLEGKIVGMLTLDELLNALVELLDIIAEAGAKDALKRIAVRDVMRPIAPMLKSDDAIGTAAALMLEKNIRAVLITSNEGLLKGIATLTDLTKYVAAFSG